MTSITSVIISDTEGYKPIKLEIADAMKADKVITVDSSSNLREIKLFSLKNSTMQNISFLIK